MSKLFSRRFGRKKRRKAAAKKRRRELLLELHNKPHLEEAASETQEEAQAIPTPTLHWAESNASSNRIDTRISPAVWGSYPPISITGNPWVLKGHYQGETSTPFRSQENPFSSSWELEQKVEIPSKFFIGQKVRIIEAGEQRTGVIENLDSASAIVAIDPDSLTPGGFSKWCVLLKYLIPEEEEEMDIGEYNDGDW